MQKLVAIALSMTVAFAVLHGAARAQENPMLLDAVRGDDVTAVRQALPEAQLEERDAEGRTALMLATRANAVEIALLLIDAGADVNARDAIRDTPFLYAGAEGRDDILKAILATGKARIGDTNRYGGTALIPAADRGHPTTMRILIEAGVDINHVNNLGWTALMEAVILGDGGAAHQEVVGLLVDAGARQIPDRDGVTPLEHARQRGFDAMVTRMAARLAR